MGLLETWILFIIEKKSTVCIYMYLQYPNACISPDIQNCQVQSGKAWVHTSKWPRVPFTSTWRSFNISAVPSPWWTSKSQINTRSTSSSWKHQQSPEKTTTTTPNLESKHIISINIVQLQTQVLPSYKKGCKCNNSIDFSCRNFPEHLLVFHLVFHVGNPAGFPQLVTFGDTSTKRSFRRTFAVMAKSWIPRRWGPKVDSKEAQWKGETFGNTSGNISLCMYIDTNTYIRYPKKKDQDFNNGNFNWIILSNAFFQELLGMEVQTHAT